MGVERTPVAEEQVADTKLAQLPTLVLNGLIEVAGVRPFVPSLPQLAEQPAESVLAVVVPIGRYVPNGQRFTPLSWPLWAKVQARPHSSRVNGCVFSSATRPWLPRRTCAITTRLLIG